MKRRALLRFLQAAKCHIIEGSRHTRVFNPGNRKWSAIPRHTEIDSFLVRKICKQLEIAPPSEA